jgi:tripartite-type tricarboxylate transporter receptor subunit TctC
MKKASRLLLVLMIIFILSGCSAQQSASAPAKDEELKYPEGPVTIVVPYGAGGAMDTAARLFAKYAEKICEQPFVISNVAGGSGSVGAMDVLSSEPDGYKVLIFDPGPGFVTTTNNKTPFDMLKDFSLVASQTADIRNLVVRKDDARFNTPEEFIQYVKDHPGEIDVGVAGAYTDASIALELIKRAGNLDMVTVAFSGAAEAKTNLLGGHVDAVSLSVGDSLAMIANDQIKVIGICSDERSDLLPDTPTFKELGIDAQWSTYRGYAFEKGTDERIVAFFEDLVKQVSEDPEYVKELNALGYPVVYLNSDEFTQLVTDKFETIKSILD